MIAASASNTIAVVISLTFVVGWIVYAVMNRSAGKAEIGSEIELAANRKPYYDDEELEGRRLQRMQLLGVLMLATVTIGLPAYWLAEPSRQANTIEVRPTVSSRGVRDFLLRPPKVDSTVQVATVE